MRVDELFGRGRKKIADPNWGSLEERQKIVKEILQFGYDTYSKPNVSTKIMMIIRELLKKDRVDLIAINQNSIMRRTITDTVAKNFPLEVLENKFNEMKQALQGE